MLISACNSNLGGTPAATIASKLGVVQSESVESIRNWAVCDGETDDLANFNVAVSQAKYGAFQLLIDCPLYLKIGMDIAKPIFIDNNTSIIFSNQGLIKVDNVFVPAFIIANSSNINLTGWNIEYIGKMPITNQTGGYYYNGTWVPFSGTAPPANAVNNVTITNWLKENRGLKFDKGYFSFWTGILDPSAIFYIKGDSSNIVLKNFHVFVESSTTPDKFIPIVFSLLPGYTNGTEVKGQPIMKPYLNVPHAITFDNISLDGFYMGWHGSTQQATFNNIFAYRYSILQDEIGENLGGVNKWFPPPHLFYLNHQNTWDSSLYNDQISLTNVMDYGVRLGKAEDKRNESNIAGNACSLKIQANNSVVNNYHSSRPDGFLDLVSSANMRISNVEAIYDSQFLDNLFPIIRFPCIGSPYTGYQNITFENINLTDMASFTFQPPITGNIDSLNNTIIFNNTTIKMNTWIGETKPFDPLTQGSTSYFSGANNLFDVAIDYDDSYNQVNKYGISIKRLEPTSYNNSIQNVPVGSFGLRSYTITNQNESQVEVLLPDTASFPLGVSYDLTRSSCRPTVNQLNPNQSCIFVLKYQPTVKGVSGLFTLKILTDSSESDVKELPALIIPYSSRN